MQYSIVSYSELNTSPDFRIDAEYFKPDYLQLENTLKGFQIEKFGKLVNEIRCGPFGSTLLCDTYLENGVIVARPFNIKDYTLENDNLVFISEKDLLEKRLKTFSGGDIFFSRVGDVRCGVVPELKNKLTISPNIIGVKVDRTRINPYYAVIFFNSKYGFPQIERGLKVVAQPTIQTGLIENLKIVIFSSRFQSQFERVFRKFFSCTNEAQKLYSQAEQTLLSELGLLNWKPKHRLSFIKNFYDTKSADRIDAEYLQPKYDQIIKAVKGYSGGWDILDNLVNIKKSIEPGSDEYQEKGIKFLRVSNLSKFGIDNGSPVYLSEKFYNENKQHQPKQGEILLSKDATPGIAYYLNEKPEEMIVSGGILRLKLKDERVNEDYLTLFLNSVLVQEQAERDAGGSVIIHWRPDQIKEVVVPIVKDNIQKQIQQKIQQSFELRNKSKQLLEIAKEGVEMAIEKNEQTAMEWINKNVKD
jgi:restriction endonuclease S subunit